LRYCRAGKRGGFQASYVRVAGKQHWLHLRVRVSRREWITLLDSGDAAKRGSVELRVAIGDSQDRWRGEKLRRMRSFEGDASMHSQQLITPRARLVYSDVRLKRQILRVEALGNGINLYRYRYRWNCTDYVGVMAQEVAAVDPEAVSSDADGYLRVDYSRLGIQLRTYQDWAEKGHAPLIPSKF
jgi:hypothetical protein